MLDALGDAMREGGQHHARYLRSYLLDVAGHSEGVVVCITGHTDNQIDIGGLQHLVGFLGSRHLGKRGRIAQAQLHVFVKQLLVDAAIILQHEGIVGIGYYQDIENTLRHQVDKRDVFQEEVIEFLGNIRCTHFSYFPAKVQNISQFIILNSQFICTFAAANYKPI